MDVQGNEILADQRRINALALGQDGNIYGATSRIWVPPYGSAVLFKFDVTSQTTTVIATIWPGEREVWNLVSNPADHRLYGTVGYQLVPRLFAFDPAHPETGISDLGQTLGPEDNIGQGGIVAAADGKIYGLVSSHLIMYNFASPGNGIVDLGDSGIGARPLTFGTDGRLYGGHTTSPTHITRRDELSAMHLPLPETVTSNGGTYNIVQDYLQNSSYVYGAGFDQKGYLINTGWDKNHLGFDFMADKGTPVSALCGGTVVRIENAKNAKAVDKYVEISHTCGGQTFLAFYAHVDAASGLVQGQPVPDTLEIGKVADWGANSHLHLAVFSGGSTAWEIYSWCRKDAYTEETLEGQTVRTLTNCTRTEPAKRDLKAYYALHSGFGWLGPAHDQQARAYLYVPSETVISWGWRDPVDVLLP